MTKHGYSRMIAVVFFFFSYAQRDSTTFILLHYNVLTENSPHSPEYTRPSWAVWAEKQAKGG